MRHIIPISGKDSMATALVQIAKQPELNYEFMFNPTGSELPEVFEWLDKVENYLGKKIVRIGENLRDIIEYEFNWFLPSFKQRYCTRMAKIEPMKKFIGKDECFVYYGIRSDENRGGFDNTTSKNITAVYPLKEACIDLPAVYQINHNAGLKPPTFFWQRLWDEVIKMISPDYITDRFKEWEIDALFAWRTRTNCAHCYNMRRYEWVGLYEHHPDLFWEFESWEHNVSEFYFCGKGYPLTLLIENSDKIFLKRVNSIFKFINSVKENDLKGLQTKLMFEDLNNEDDEFTFDMLSMTSCGLLCGK